MNQQLIYSVSETNRLGGLRGRLITRDPLIALSDWLLKTHKPVGFPPGERPQFADLKLEVLGLMLAEGAVAFSLEGHFLYRDDPVRKIKIETNIATLALDEGFTALSIPYYRREEYWAAIVKLKERLERYAGGHMLAMFILAQFAARDPSHEFWKPIVRRRGMGFDL